MVTEAMKLKDVCSFGMKSMANLNRELKSKYITLSTKVHILSFFGFSRSHEWMWELNHKEAEYWRIDAFELWCWRKLLRIPWTARKPVYPKGNQSWIFIWRTCAIAETSIIWPPDVKNWFTGRDPDAGKIEGGRRRGRQRMGCLDGITDSMDMSLSKLGVGDG